MTPPNRPSWSRFFEEFHCQSCGYQEAYRSRPRGFFERYVLPFLLFQAVRCERCFHRAYVLRSIPTMQRSRLDPKQSQASQAASGKAAHSDTRVA